MVDFDFTTEGDFVPGSTTEWDVFGMLPGDDAPVYLATLYNAREKAIRVELNGPGSGSFAINRTSPECTETILAQGNLVKVRIPEIHDDYIFVFFLETGDFTLISSQEAGGEMLTFGGRGILSYLEYARAASLSFVTGGDDPDAGVWRAYAAGTGSAPGQILRRMLEEFQHVDRVYPVLPSQPLPLLTIDFDYDDDSTADPWDETDATDEFAYQVGEDGLAIATRLWETETIVIQMAPDFLLSAYNSANFGRDLAGPAFGAGVVRFQRGINIATELRRELAVTEVQTHMLAAGEADKYGGAVLPDAATRVTKEGFVAAFGTGTTALNGVAAAELADRLRKSDSIQFPIANRRTEVDLANPVTVGSVLATPGVATAGYYLPGPEGTLGDFWVGDTVRVHTGSGQFDYNETDWRVNAITIARDDDNHELIVIPELIQPVPTPPITGYMMSFLIQRGGSTGFGADIVPRGTDDASVTFQDPWTWLGGTYHWTGPGEYPMDVAYIEEGPAHDEWVWGPGLNGTSRPTGFHLILTGATGPPVYLGDYPTTPGYRDPPSGGSTFWSPTLDAPADGIMFCLLAGTTSGDVGTGLYTVDGPVGVVTLRQAMSSDIPLGDPGGDTYPHSMLVYKMVTEGETVEFTFSDNFRTGWNTLVVFVPGPVAIDQFTHSGSSGGALAWSW